MLKRNNKINFNKGHIVMAWPLGWSISKTCLEACEVIFSTHKKERLVNTHQGHECPRLMDAFGKRRLACVLIFHRRCSVAQAADSLNAGCSRKLSKHTIHHWRVCCWLATDRSQCWSWTWLTAQNPYNVYVNIRTAPWSIWRRLLPLNHMSLWSLYIEKKWLQVMLKINSKETWTCYSCGCCFTVPESWFCSPGCNTYSRTSFVTHQSLFSNLINSAFAWSLKPAPFTNNEVSFMILNDQNVMTSGHGYCSQRVGKWFRCPLMCPPLGSDMVVPFSHKLPPWLSA